ncbi:hypothetical protein LTR37_012362 [Vermiconidia calcicola]|uniref:Uncharacterized protein n=1 Tax=Vermiconidia calcicola TaxID=1690605 RepID=A0ACC3MZF0_9PEZI|nr:hypothetical protein LTR37_012362 [Vermiconidia calcicola]
MADPISMIASIIAIAELTATLIEHLRTATKATEEQRTLKNEANSVLGILTQLESQVRKATGSEDWFRTVQFLGVQNGPLDQYHLSLKKLTNLTKDRDSVGSKFVGAITWRYRKEDVERTIQSMRYFISMANLALSNDSFTLLQALKRDVKGLADQLSDAAVDTRKKTAEDWLLLDDPVEAHTDKVRHRHPRTGQWFLDATESWRSGDTHRLWCLGMPGAGKTILASKLIDSILDMPREQHQRICHFYFNYKESGKQDTAYVYRSLLKQLSQQSEGLSEHVKFLQDYRKTTGKEPGHELIQRYLLRELDSGVETWIVIDAFDESRDDDGLREHLLETLRSAPHSVRWLITSRDTPAVRDAMDSADVAEQNPLTISANEDDIRQYVEGRLTTDPKFKMILKKNPELRAEVVDEISHRVQGMFLLAVLHMDSLAGQSKPNAMRKALKMLPEGLDAAYDQAVQRMKDFKDWTRARSALTWIVQAQRPLHIEEFSHALSIESGMTSLDKGDVEVGEVFVDECAGLVVIEPGSQLVRLVHETAQDYFSKPRADPVLPGTSFIVAQACLSYLQLDALDEGPCESPAEVAKRIDDLPFLRYCSRYWGHHVSILLDDELMKARALKLMADTRRLGASVQVLSLPDQADLVSLSIEEFHRPWYEGSATHAYLGATPLCMVAYFGLGEVAETLLATAIDANVLDQTCSQGRTPLHYAAGSGHQRMLQLLIERGADVDIGDEHGVTALHLASDGTSPESYSTPLLWAASENRIEIVKILLEAGADIEAGNAWHRTPLHVAVRRNRSETVEFLIAKGANIEAERDGRGTPLTWAAESGHADVAKLLLEHGARLCVSSYQGSPLELAITYNHLAAEELFKTHDQRFGGNSAIVRFTMRSAISRHGHRDKAELAFRHLLEYFPESERDAVLAEELDATIRLANFDSAEFLIALGTDISKKWQFDRSIMHMSLHQNRFDLFEIGLRRGLDYEAPDVQGCRPIHHAAAGGCMQGLEWLSSRSVDLNEVDHHGWTPLHWAAFQGHGSSVDLLLAAGSRTDVIDAHNRTPLQVAAATRPMDKLLRSKLGESEKEAGSTSPSMQVTASEEAWQLLCALHLPELRGLHAYAEAEPFDPQWDWDWARSLAFFCDYSDGQFGNGRLAQLVSASNEPLYSAAKQRILESATSDEHGCVHITFESAPKLPAFCDGCCYLTIGKRYRCEYDEALNLCYRCIADAETLFPKYIFIER